MGRLTFSANLGFLWGRLPLDKAILAAKAEGFDAVEFHWPYDVPLERVRDALKETGLPVMGLNTRRGNLNIAQMGRAVCPRLEKEAKEDIREALDYAYGVNASMVHVMAGRKICEPMSDEVAQADMRLCFVENLRYASKMAEPLGIDILIEPLNAFDAPGYFLSSVPQAVDIIETVDRANVKLMFDCYHAGRTEADPIGCLETAFPHIGHVQIASVPERILPKTGDPYYVKVFETLRRLGWSKPIGCEYVHDETQPQISILCGF